MAFMKPQSDKFLIKIGNLYNIFEIVDCRFENLYVDVDFAQIFVVDCRPKRKNVVESTERLTPPGPPPLLYNLSCNYFSLHLNTSH